VVTRAALGAGRTRLVRQFLAESLLLSLAGGLVGVAVARWGTDLLVALGSAKIPRAHEIALDWSAFGFLLLVCLATAVLFGLAPALTAARIDVQRALRESGGRSTMGRGYGRLRDGLVVAEVAFAFVLGLGALLLIRELIRLRSTDTGMVTGNTITLHLTPRAPARDYYAIEEGVAQLAGVQAAGFTQLVPLQNWGWEADFSIPGRSAEGRRVAGLRYVTPGYFPALGIPILRGRAFTERDHADALPVILINDALARRYFPGADPVGIQLDRGTIVGVVGDVRQVGLDRPAEPELYYAAAQNVTMASDIGMTLIVRTTGRPEPLIDGIRSAVRAVNPGLAIFNLRTMEQVLADSLWELNLYRWLIGLFAALALALAVIGLYGVMSYTVTARMREFAVRLSLGSDPARLARLVLARGVRLASAGIVAGGMVALLVTPALGSLSVRGRGHPATYAGIAAALLAITLVACFIPAIRAARVDPAAALRHD
jgi:predicted permease